MRYMSPEKDYLTSLRIRELVELPIVVIFYCTYLVGVFEKSLDITSKRIYVYICLGSVTY